MPQAVDERGTPIDRIIEGTGHTRQAPRDGDEYHSQMRVIGKTAAGSYRIELMTPEHSGRYRTDVLGRWS